MKQLTVAQAARELNNLARQRLNGGPLDESLKVRIAQFTGAVEEAITHLQMQVDQLRQPPKN